LSYDGTMYPKINLICGYLCRGRLLFTDAVGQGVAGSVGADDAERAYTDRTVTLLVLSPHCGARRTA